MTNTHIGSGASGEFPARPTGWIDRFSSFTLEHPTRLVIWTICVSTLLRLIGAELIGFGNGEAYYLATARHFALSYYDQPPLFVWIAWATMKITGSEWLFLLRLPFIAMFVVTTWLMYRLGTSLFNQRVGALAAFLLNISPVFSLSVGSWVQPDGPLMLTMLAGVMCICRLAFGPPVTSRLLMWAWVGVWFGLAMLAKYHAILVMLGLFVFAITSREHRRWFFEPGPYLALAIALVIFSPVIVWNWQNSGASFGFQGGRILESEGFRVEWLIRSLIGQMAWVGPWIWVPMIESYGRALWRGPQDVKAWFLCCGAALPIILFTVAALWAPLGWHFHWQAPGYILLFPLLGVMALDRLERNHRVTHVWLFASLVSLLVIFSLLVAQVATGWMRFLVPASIAPQLSRINDPTLEAQDWPEVRQAVERLGLLHKPRLFVTGGQWFQAGRVDVQLGRDLPVVCLCEDPRNIAFNWDHRNFAGWDALIIGTDHYVGNAPKLYGPYFDKIELLERVDIHRGGSVVATVPIYYATNYKQLYPMPLPPR